jgi:hypothetical protein
MQNAMMQAILIILEFMTALFVAVYSVTRTKRRRFLWCAWWTAPPTSEPFRPPDAWSGGARSEDEAKSAAELAAGMPLQPIEGRWAGAWVRFQAGLPPFVDRQVRVPALAGGVAPAGPHTLLGVKPGASLEELKAAFRRQALAHHPDHGGDPAVFIALKRAYDSLVRRRVKKRRA